MYMLKNGQFLSSLMISNNIWEFPLFWLVYTVVTWLKMRLWEISGLMTLHRRERLLLTLGEWHFSTERVLFCTVWVSLSTKYGTKSENYIFRQFLWDFSMKRDCDFSNFVPYSMLNDTHTASYNVMWKVSLNSSHKILM